jgi:hypothetical protein
MKAADVVRSAQKVVNFLQPLNDLAEHMKDISIVLQKAEEMEGRIAVLKQETDAVLAEQEKAKKGIDDAKAKAAELLRDAKVKADRIEAAANEAAIELKKKALRDRDEADAKATEAMDKVALARKELALTVDQQKEAEKKLADVRAKLKQIMGE